MQLYNCNEIVQFIIVTGTSKWKTVAHVPIGGTARHFSIQYIQCILIIIIIHHFTPSGSRLTNMHSSQDGNYSA